MYLQPFLNQISIQPILLEWYPNLYLDEIDAHTEQPQKYPSNRVIYPLHLTKEMPYMAANTVNDIHMDVINAPILDEEELAAVVRDRIDVIRAV